MESMKGAAQVRLQPLTSDWCCGSTLRAMHVCCVARSRCQGLHLTNCCWIMPSCNATVADRCVCVCAPV